MRGELSEQAERAASIGTQIDEHRARMSEIDERAKSLEADAASARNVMDGRRMRIENREREAAEANDALTKQIVELRSADSRIAMLSEMEKEYEGFAGAVKTVMREAKRGTLRGIHGTVAEWSAPTSAARSPLRRRWAQRYRTSSWTRRTTAAGP